MKLTVYTVQIAKYRLCERVDAAFVDTTVKSGLSHLAPSWPMVMAHKSGDLSDEEYTTAYEEIIQKSQYMSPDDWEELSTMGTIALGCYCRAGLFCHRHLLVDHLEEYCKSIEVDFEYIGEITDQTIGEFECLKKKQTS